MIKAVDMQGTREAGLDVLMLTAECKSSQMETMHKARVGRDGELHALSWRTTPCTAPPRVYQSSSSLNQVKLTMSGVI